MRGNDATTSPSGNLHQTHLIWFDIVGVVHEGFHIRRGLNDMSETIITSESATAPRTVTLHNGQVLSFNSNISTNIEEIPIIDARKIWCERLEDRRSVAEEIREAARTIGFFYLVNHVRAIPVRGLHEHKQCLIVRRESMRSMPRAASHRRNASSLSLRRRRWRFGPGNFRPNTRAITQWRRTTEMGGSITVSPQSCISVLWV